MRILWELACHERVAIKVRRNINHKREEREKLQGGSRNMEWDWRSKLRPRFRLRTTPTSLSKTKISGENCQQHLCTFCNNLAQCYKALKIVQITVDKSILQSVSHLLNYRLVILEISVYTKMSLSGNGVKAYYQPTCFESMSELKPSCWILTVVSIRILVHGIWCEH